MIRFYNEDIRFRLRQIRLHRSWIESVILAHRKEKGELSIIFTSNAHLLEINREYLNHNYFTDVISFDYGEGNSVSGDIFIGLEKVRENAKDYGVSSGDELRRVMIHGVLHLVGFDDGTEEEKRIMRNMENEALHLWFNQE